MEKKLWEVIANQCAPVLADVKPSNLLILTSEEEEVFLQMEELPHISVPERPVGVGACMASDRSISETVRLPDGPGESG